MKFIGQNYVICQYLSIFCQNIMLIILLVTLILTSKTQYIQSGIVTLKSVKNNNISEYSLPRLSSSQKILLSLSTFQWVDSQTFCHYSEQQVSIKITCSSGVNTISYLKYYQNPLIYASFFTYYFFDNQTQNVVWTPPLDIKSFTNPKIGSFFIGFMSNNNSKNAIQLKSTQDNLAIQIIRTPNIKYVNFTYIIFQSYPNFQYSFFLTDSGQSMKTLQSRKFLNFYGLSNIRLFSLANTQIPLIRSNTSAIFSLMNQLMINNNTILQGLLFQKTNKPYNCSFLPFYDADSDICVVNCPLNSKLYPQIYAQYFSYNQARSYYGKNQTIRVNNLDQLHNNSGSNCEERKLDDYKNVICLKCKKGYKLIQNKCICNYQFYQQNNTCHQCKNGQQCRIYTNLKMDLIETDDININHLQFSFLIPQIYDYQYDKKKSFRQNIEINSQKFELLFLRNNKSGLYQSRLQNISIALPFQIHFSIYPLLDNQDFFILSKQNITFLWKLNQTKIIKDRSLRPSNFLKKTKRFVSLLNENFHYIILLSFFIKTASCLLDYYQSASIIYLFASLSLPKQYEDIQNNLKSIFSLIPSPLVIFFGQNGQIKTPKYDFKIIKKEDLIILVKGKQGQMFIGLVFNQIIIICLQFLGMVLITKIMIYLLKPSRNKISSISQKQVSQNFSKNSSLNKHAIMWPANIRQKALKFFIKYDQLYLVSLLSNIKILSMGLCILFLQQSLIQTYDFDVLFSKISGFISFSMFLFLPIAILYDSSLNIFKSINIIYKRRKYTKASLCTYFITNYYIGILFALNIIFIQAGIAQIIAFIVIIMAKFIFLFPVMKNIEKIRHICYLFIFLGGFLSHKNDILGQILLKQSIISLILLVIACDAFKVLKSIIISILNILNKSEPISENTCQKIKQKFNFISVQILKDSKKDPIKSLQKSTKNIFGRKFHAKNPSQLILLTNNNANISKINQKKSNIQ